MIHLVVRQREEEPCDLWVTAEWVVWVAGGQLFINYRLIQGTLRASWSEGGAANGSGIFSPSLDNHLRLDLLWSCSSRSR